jgi:DNA-binding transcriptional LysR family regulator
MEALRQLVPSINSLVVFEAAGRLASFSAAARELGMTQAAVSYAVGRLELQLATSLFVREHRRVRLTEAGQRFHADVSLGLSHIHKSAQSLRSAAAGDHVTLSASAAFAAYWMAPRLQQFREDLPGVDLRIQTSDRDLDLISEGIPLGIRGGDPQDWPGYASEIIAPEEIYPVCGTSYAARFGAPETVDALRTHRLIHVEEAYRPAATWDDWFGSAGIGQRLPPDGLRINDYVSVIQAAIEGQGVALGWNHLVERLVARGLLLRLTSQTLVTGKSFYVTWQKDVRLSGQAQDVRDWLAGLR